MQGAVDPNEFCVNCHAKISGMYRTCEFCGKVWWKYEKTESENTDREGDSTKVQ